MGGINRYSCTLFVPDESLSLYQTTAPWKEFLNINSIATGIEETTAEPVLRAVPQGVFNLSGQRLSAPQKGLNIINGKKVLVQ